MKIGISCYPTLGGSGVVATELAIALAKSGDEVHLISYGRPSRWAEVDGKLFFHLVTVPNYPLFEYPPYSMALATTMVEVSRQAGLDLMHVHYAVPNAVSAILARDILGGDRIKVVTTLHGTDVTLVGNHPSYLETTRYGIERSDRVTAVSSWLRQATLEQLHIDMPIEVIPNFVDAERFAAWRQRKGARLWARSGERIIVHASNFRPVKRIVDVVEAFARIAGELPARLLLVGDGPERRAAQQACRRLGVEGRVHFLGVVREIEGVLAGADLFLMASQTESFGLAALEALASGVPVAAYEVGGLPEVVEDGVHGRLVTDGDVDALAAAGLEILRREDGGASLGAAGRELSAGPFAIDRVVAQYRECYRRTVTGE